MMRRVTIGCVVALVVSGAMGGVLADFEAGNPFTAGAVVDDPAAPGNKVLLVSGETARLNLPDALQPGQTLAIDVFDKGVSFLDDGNAPAADSRPAGSVYGWNVGVAGNHNVGVALINKSFLGGNGGYGWTGGYLDS